MSSTAATNAGWQYPPIRTDCRSDLHTEIFKLDKPYTPGLVTAEIELVSGIALIVYLAVNHLGAWYDYTFGPFVFIFCFAMMQRSLMAMIGLRYKDMFAIMKKRLGK